MNVTVEDSYKCPECGYPQFCPCPTCGPHVPEGYKPWIWDETGEFVSCAQCGLKAHVDWWMDVEWDYFKDKMFKCEHKEE
jgi:DNA-directed RNA polymerase subunit RPC12/RpoP